MFWGNQTDRRVEEIESSVARSFQNVKQDVSLSFQWIEYLHALSQDLQRRCDNLARENRVLSHENQVLKHHIESVKSDVSECKSSISNLPRPLSKDEIRILVDSHYSLAPLAEKIRVLESHIEELKHIKSAPERVVQVVEKAPREISFKERLIQDISKKSKDYVKSFIKSVIHKYGKIAGVNLRGIVVEDQHLCSKSSFYRILDELTNDSEVSVIVGKKENIFVSKSSKKVLANDD